MNYRVLLEDEVDGKKFNFAVGVEAENQTGSETLAQYGYTEADGARWEAGNKALQEFPTAVLIDVKLQSSVSYFFIDGCTFS